MGHERFGNGGLGKEGVRCVQDTHPTKYPPGHLSYNMRIRTLDRIRDVSEGWIESMADSVFMAGRLVFKLPPRIRIRKTSAFFPASETSSS